MGIPYRCGTRSCYARRSLPKPIEEYQRVPTCPRCGKDTLTLDKHRHTTELKKLKATTCYCDDVINPEGKPFPHQVGSSVWCKEHPEGPSENDFLTRYGYRYCQ